MSSQSSRYDNGSVILWFKCQKSVRKFGVKRSTME